MSSKPNGHEQEQTDLVFLYALQALSSDEVAAAEIHLAACSECRRELQNLRPIVRSFSAWPTDVVRPSASLWERVAQRIASESGQAPLLSPPKRSPKLEWEEPAPGIHVKVLARDDKKHSVSMLVRLDPGTGYPGHTHSGVEELHLLHGVLKVDDRTLYPGDFIRADAGSIDRRVWSETGCTCFLMTSTKDALF
jgi:anti-sigma factor ChrR (cupin superfamily)